jgi:hypothetical protein
MLEGPPERVLMVVAVLSRLRSNPDDPFRRSLLGRPVWTRLAVVAPGLVLFWLAVAWAIAVP